ncbi:XdhC family protein, partial [Methylacidimicrobium cyclopophantes]|uniref:XdhC family protein n=1 Tax=Methylacidimicrobium cyclopophantes TaxID=1041766 RepID=UPI0024832A61
MRWDWPGKLAQLLPLHPEVILITLIEIRGHAPQEAGAKMIVTREESFGTIGGGNLEKSALEAAKKMLAEKTRTPRRLELRLNPAEGEWGAQCCGGEVSILLEPLFWERKQVALFGAGHVGLALARILSLLPLDLFLVDSRPERLAVDRLVFPSAAARLLPR